MNQEQAIDEIIKSALEEAIQSSIPQEKEIQIFSADGLLDSISLVSFLLDVEREIKQKLGKRVRLISDRAFSRRVGPFESTKNLKDFILELLDLEAAETN